MCYNCGCEMPDDPMGQGHALTEPEGKSITDHTFQHLSNDWNMDESQVKELVYGMLIGEKQDPVKQKFMDHLYEVAGESQGMTKQQAMDETKRLLKIVLKKN
jgi:hypothetical protein